MESLQRSRRMTRQRRQILDALRGTDTHPTADWIYEQVRRVMPKISLGTVYRNLRVLKETGDILELNYGSTYSRFDGNTDNHYHFVCTSCGKIGDVMLSLSDQINRQASEAVDGEVEFHRLEFYGVCGECTLK